MVNHGKEILREHYEKHHLKEARRRLLLAFLSILIIATFYIWFGIQFALASDKFIPR